MGHPESAGCLLLGPSTSSPASAAGTHAPAPMTFCAPCPAPSSPTASLCHPRGGLAHSLPSGSSLAPLILKLQGVAAVSPEAHLSLTGQGILPAGLGFSASQAIQISHLHSSTSQWDFPKPLWPQQQLCCHFWDVWIWVCTEDLRAGHYLDFAHWVGVLCSRAHFTPSSCVLFLIWQFSPLVYPCLDFTKHISQGKQVSSCR